ncbi:peroxiredoxin family protein [Flavobacterium sp. N1736]|uniref:peroxiredoxin family protein n=1 Tax=Flavobacterium sp. N1736 TaxID=2986823 RepID=UPI0022256A7B|nr:redoxin domain-containing protein [Flavobacterium sp. N1736]
MKRKLYISVMVIFSVTALQAQTVQISLPHYAGKEYSYALTQGDKRDTIAKGMLTKTGTAALVLPKAYKGYKGLAQFTVAKTQNIEFIVNNENIAVSSTAEQFTAENVKITNSPENDFIKAAQQQKSILDKMGIAKAVLQVYQPQEPLYIVFEKEKANLNSQFAIQQTLVQNSPLYAARVREMLNFLMHTGNTPDMSEEDLIKQFSPYIRNTLDIDALYTSNLWSPVIQNWVQMQQYAVKDDAVLFEDAKVILSRIKSNTVYTAFAEKMVGVFAKAGKDYLVTELGAYAAKSGRVLNPGNNLLSAMNDLGAGSIAPVLQTATGKKTIKNKTLLFFFESGCNNCENEMHSLLGNYDVVTKNGFEVITVAADLTKNAGDGHGHVFPWKDQLCDYKGFKGPNFINYGIIGTPTFFVIDEKGKITGRYATLAEAGVLQ